MTAATTRGTATEPAALITQERGGTPNRRFKRGVAASACTAAALALVTIAWIGSASAQQLDLAHGGPIAITASDGIEWRQDQREVIARGNARAVRQNVTVTADRLTAFYRPTSGAAPQPVESAINDTSTTGGNEIYRLEAEGNVHIFTATDQAQGDRAIYDIDQAVLVLTGHDLKVTTPNDVLTARDSMEYWSQKHMAVARGDAVVVTNDGRRLSADTLVAYTTDTPQPQAGQTPPPAGQTQQVAAKSPQPADDPLIASGKLQKVDAFGNVVVRTATDTAIAVVTRAASSGPSYLFKPQGLNPSQRYTVWFEINPAVYSQSGAQLMANGVRIPLASPYSSDVVHMEPQQ